MLRNHQVYQLLAVITQTFEVRKKELSKLDAVIGDGDHGFSIARGCRAGMDAVEQLEQDSSVSKYLRLYGRTLTDEVGGAMGPLFGLLFTELAEKCSGQDNLGLNELAEGLSSALSVICELGGAKAGDKTMVDAIIPSVESLMSAVKCGLSLKEAVLAAEHAAWSGVESTVWLQAKRGRSKFLQERSIGYQDAGATSFYYLIHAIRKFLDEEAVE